MSYEAGRACEEGTESVRSLLWWLSCESSTVVPQTGTHGHRPLSEPVNYSAESGRKAIKGTDGGEPGLKKKPGGNLRWPKALLREKMVVDLWAVGS